MVGRIADQAGIPAGLTFMDLRRSGLTELGDGTGATDDEIRSVSGHKAGHALKKRHHARKADGGHKPWQYHDVGRG